MIKQVPLEELNMRMERFRTVMSQYNPGWEMAVIFSKINRRFAILCG